METCIIKYDRSWGIGSGLLVGDFSLSLISSHNFSVLAKLAIFGPKLCEKGFPVYYTLLRYSPSSPRIYKIG